MKTVLIHYFSGTGNSHHAAELIGEVLSKNGYKTIIHAIENSFYPDTVNMDLHIFFFPVYATAVPHIMCKYILNLPNGKKAETAIISTNGRISTRFRDGYQGWALHQARLLLYFKNFDVCFSDTLDYPHNMTAFFPPRSKENNQKIMEKVLPRIHTISNKIIKDQKSHRKIFLLNFIWSIPFGFLYSLIGRRVIGKLYVADLKCDLCGLCVQKCPVNAIHIKNNKIHWNWNCEGCMRCINICPKQAIQMSFVRLMASILVYWKNPLYLSYKFIPLIFLKKLGSAGKFTFEILIDIFLFFLFFSIIDFVFFVISKLHFFRNIISFGFTRFFNRYRLKDFLQKK